MIEFFPTREVFVILFGWQVRWYGVLYVVAFWLAWWMLPRLQRYRGLSLTRDQWTYIVTWAVVGVLVGGRLGYVVLYEPVFFWKNPLEIFQLWHGGMSAHGGFIGVAVAVWYACRVLAIDWWAVLDVAVVPATLGLAWGRLGNWINQELFPGNWALVVVGADCLIAWVCYSILRMRKRGHGQVVALFLLLYAVVRFFVEFIRLPEWPTGVGLSRGQLFTLPVLLIGIWLWYKHNGRGHQREKKIS